MNKPCATCGGSAPTGMRERPMINEYPGEAMDYKVKYPNGITRTVWGLEAAEAEAAATGGTVIAPNDSDAYVDPGDDVEVDDADSDEESDDDDGEDNDDGDGDESEETDGDDTEVSAEGKELAETLGGTEVSGTTSTSEVVTPDDAKTEEEATPPKGFDEMDRDELKAALTAADISFADNIPTAKAIELLEAHAAKTVD